MSRKNLLEKLDAWEAKADPSAPDPNHPYPDSPTAFAPDAVIGGGASEAPPSYAAGQGRDDEVLLDALDSIDPARLDYQEWVSVGMALHYEGVPCDAWDTWSRRDPDRYKPGECERKWRGFGKGAGQQVKGGTIVEMAKRGGWTRPARTPSEPAPDPAPPATPNDGETAIQGLGFISIEDLPLSEDDLGPDDPPILNDILDKRSKAIFTAPSKAGKTWAMIRLGSAVATGSPWLDKYETTRGRVLYVNCELKPKRFIKRMKMVCRADGLDYAQLVGEGRFKVLNLRGKKIHDIAILHTKLRELVQCGEFDLIIIDPTYKLFKGNENDAEDVGRFVDTIDEMCADLGSAIVYIHHHPKADMRGRRSIDRGSGSGVFGRDVDASIDLLEIPRPDDAEEHLYAFTISFTLRDHMEIPDAILGVRYSKERGCEQWIDHAGQFSEWDKSSQSKGGDKTGLDKHEQAVAKRQRAASVLLWHLLENGIPTDENGEPVGFTTRQAMEIVDAHLGEGYIGKKDQAFREFFINNSSEIIGVEFVQDKGSKMWHLVPQKPPRAPEDETGEHGAGEQLALGDA